MAIINTGGGAQALERSGDMTGASRLDSSDHLANGVSEACHEAHNMETHTCT